MIFCSSHITFCLKLFYDLQTVTFAWNMVAQISLQTFVVEESSMIMFKQKGLYSRINDIKGDYKHKPQKTGSAGKQKTFPSTFLLCIHILSMVLKVYLQTSTQTKRH